MSAGNISEEESDAEEGAEEDEEQERHHVLPTDPDRNGAAAIALATGVASAYDLSFAGCVCVWVCVGVCVRESGSPWPFKVRPRVGPSLPRQLGAARIPFGGPPDHGQEVHQAADVRQSMGHTATTPQAPVDLPLGPLV